MQRFRIGDKIHIIYNGTKEERTLTIMDMLEDYDGQTCWLKSDQGRVLVEFESPATIFEKIDPLIKTTI